VKNFLLALFGSQILFGCGSMPISLSQMSASRSVEKFDFTDVAPDAGSVARQLKRLERVANTQGLLYLDWELIFPSDSQDSFTCANEIITPTLSEQASSTAGAAASRYVLPFSRVSNHFGLEVIVGSESRYPFNSVTCHESGASPTTVSIRGYYSGVVYLVPTAVQVQLRPLSLMGAAQ